MEPNLGSGQNLVGINNKSYFKFCLNSNIMLRCKKSEAERINWNFCSHSCRTSFYNKGNKYNLGKKLSKSTEDKMSRAKIGKPNYKNRLITGSRHWNWQGGKTIESIRLRHNAEYKEWRKSVFKRDNYTCQECGERGGYLNADHIKPWCLFPELRFDIDNGKTLCVYCHKKTPTFAVKVSSMTRENFELSTE